MSSVSTATGGYAKRVRDNIQCLRCHLGGPFHANPPGRRWAQPSAAAARPASRLLGARSSRAGGRTASALRRSAR